MRYLGYEIRMAAGRYDVYAPDGQRIGAYNDSPGARRWVREHRAAVKRHAAAVARPPASNET